MKPNLTDELEKVQREVEALPTKGDEQTKLILLALLTIGKQIKRVADVLEGLARNQQR